MVKCVNLFLVEMALSCGNAKTGDQNIVRFWPTPQNIVNALAHLHLFLERTLAIIVIFDLLLEMLLMFSDESNFVLSDISLLKPIRNIAFNPIYASPY